MPSSGADQPSWGRVAVIAAIGFGIGVAWPRLAGIRPGPSVPETAASAAVGSAVASAPAPAPSSAAVPAASAPVAVRSEAPTPANAPIVQEAAGGSSVHASVSHGFVSSCRTSEGESLKGSECGDLAGLDGVVLPRLRKLAECPAAADANGKLHLTLHVDFGRGSLSADVGHGRNVGNAEAILACAKAALADATVGGIRHESARYNVAYVVTFAGGSAGAEGAGGSGGSGAASSSGEGAAPAAEVTAPAATAARPGSNDGAAQVEWQVALVRDTPKTGKVLARLPRGTKLKIGPVNDGWYPVKYGDDFASEGWVYRGAIGR